MPNDWFEFKQFKITQARSAMKVSTDACIQGAWTAAVLRQSKMPGKVLDIGAGTGLLSLMLAQQLSGTTFTAIEPDQEAAAEAAENFKASPWNDRLEILPFTLQEFQPEALFDAAICNPPFFHQHLQAENPARNMARHDIGLSKNDLAQHSMRCTKPEGLLSILYPATEWESWLKTAKETGWHLQRQLEIIPRDGKATNRIVGIFAKQQQESIMERLLIRQPDNNYTKDFCDLLRDYYLFL